MPEAPSPTPPSPTCPACGKRFAPDASGALPFCSERCRLIDLGRWLNEKYGLPYEAENRPEGTDEDA